MQKNKGRFNNFIELIKGKKTVNNFKKYDNSINCDSFRRPDKTRRRHIRHQCTTTSYNSFNTY